MIPIERIGAGSGEVGSGREWRFPRQKLQDQEAPISGEATASRARKLYQTPPRFSSRPGTFRRFRLIAKGREPLLPHQRIVDSGLHWPKFW
jgi:hypothetical protein